VDHFKAMEKWVAAESKIEGGFGADQLFLKEICGEAARWRSVL